MSGSHLFSSVILTLFPPLFVQLNAYRNRAYKHCFGIEGSTASVLDVCTIGKRRFFGCLGMPQSYVQALF